MKFIKPIILLIVLGVSFFGNAQKINGYVLDEQNNPVPYAKVWVKNYSNVGTITNFEGFFEIALQNQGNYEVIFSAIGYETQEFDVIIKGFETVRQDVYLKETNTQLETVEIKEKKKNVGYEIVKHVIAHKKELEQPIKGYTCDVYLKGSETFDVKQKKKKKGEEEENLESSDETPEDLFDNGNTDKNENPQNSRLNLVETYLTINFEYPNKLKEIKTAQTKLGYPQQVYLKHSPVTIDAYFNFYQGLMNKERLHETPIISPLHSSGILSYKYKLKEIITEGKDTIYRVRISPRSVGTTTLEGDLYIKKHEWVLTKVDLSMHKGNLKIYDDFRIIQEYTKMDSIWMVTKQTFIYKTKFGKETIHGQTDVVYSNYVLNPEFPEKYFNNEIGITKDDAYKKDSTYWKEIRPVQLTKEEQRKKFVQDSIKIAHTKKEYLDSVDAAYNKITFLKVLYWGVTHRNRAKKTNWYFSSLNDFIEPINIGGPRFGPGIGYSKRFEDYQWIYAQVNTSFGYLNQDFRGNARLVHLYNPKNFGRYTIDFRHSLAMFNNYVPYLDYIDPSSYYFADQVSVSHNIEIINGLYFGASANWARRSSIDGLDFYNWKGEELQTAEPISFDPYNTFRTRLSLSYTPGQKFMTEPNRKIVLGSRWPTFGIYHRKGWKNILGSSVNFDKLSVSASQSFNIGTIGKSYYFFGAGKYVNQDSVYYIDQQFFRKGDIGLTSFFMSDPLYSFQNLAEAYNTRDIYAQIHYIHHFNGFIINKIPFMKKTGIRSVGGGGMLFLPEYNNLYYQELFFGIERKFKFARQFIRIGTYAVFSDSNYQPAKLQFKIRFNIEDPQDLNYNF